MIENITLLFRKTSIPPRLSLWQARHLASVIAPADTAFRTCPHKNLAKNHFFCYNQLSPNVGDSPSGKAVGSGPTIRGFESLIPSQ